MIKINSLDHQGRGISKIDGKIIFVENALPDEIVEVKLLKNKKKYIEGIPYKYIKKSNKRIKPNCPYYEYCGGCNIMHMSYDDQLNFKQNKINNIIKKYINEEIKVNNIVNSNKINYYRNKVTFQVKNKLGFYKNDTYEIIPIDNCLISDKLINNSIQYLKKLDLTKISKIVCRAGSNELMIIIETNDKKLDISPIRAISNSIYLKVNSSYIHIYGNKNIYEYIKNYKFIISPDSFFQVNLDTCLKLYNKIKDYVGKNKKVLDLYCGTGSIGIFINEDNHVVGIEINESANKDALVNKEINNISNIDFICGDSGKKLKNINFQPDIIIVDPPRNGLNKETINNILNFNSKKIIYVSCDPMTLARDLNIFKNTYNIKEITPFDMFPNTYHVECIALLENKNI